MDSRLLTLFMKSVSAKIQTHPKYQYYRNLLQFFEPASWMNRCFRITYKRAKSIDAVAKELCISRELLEELFSVNVLTKKTTPSGMIKVIESYQKIKDSYVVTCMSGIYEGKILVHVDGKYKDSHYPGNNSFDRQWRADQLRIEAFKMKKIFVSETPTEVEMVSLMLVSMGELDLDAVFSTDPMVAFSFSTEWTNKYLLLKQEIDDAKSKAELEKITKELDEARSEAKRLQDRNYTRCTRSKPSDEEEQLFADAMARYSARYYADGKHDSSGGWPGNSY